MISHDKLINREESLAIIGLGYVGISLAVNFSKKVNVIGFDIDTKKINQYKNGIDLTNQTEEKSILGNGIHFTSDETKLKDAKFFIIAIPTPIYEDKLPNLEYLIEASKILGRNLSSESIVVYESTVYPGVTEDICIPILEDESGLKCGVDFKVGYSPERVNPGDTINKLESIVKIVSGMDEETLEIISDVYELIIKSGVLKVDNIKIAEAAKLIENVQRDVNIALINEISIILHKLDIDTESVLEATSTKWNSLGFTPGLVGGHCIGVDTYFLTYIAEKLELYPEVILAGRKANDYMPQYISDSIIKRLHESMVPIKGANIAIFGFSYKENCPDIRNTKVAELIILLEKQGLNIKVIDPIVYPEEILDKYEISISDVSEIRNMDCLVFAVKHEDFINYSLESLKSLYSQNKEPVLIDIKGIFDRKEAKSLGYNYWRL